MLGIGNREPPPVRPRNVLRVRYCSLMEWLNSFSKSVRLLRLLLPAWPFRELSLVGLPSDACPWHGVGRAGLARRLIAFLP